MEVTENLPLIYQAEGLLKRFPPTGTQAPPFSIWEKAYQQRLKSGDAALRLRRWVTNLVSGDEALISYEPIAQTEQTCEEQLHETGLARGLGGYLFVQRNETGELETFGSVVGSQNVLDVLVYRDRYIYFTSTIPDYERGDPPNPVWTSDPNNQGWASAEILFHETSHLMIHPVEQALYVAGRDLHLAVPQALWHLALFYSAGELTKRALAERGVAYEPYLYKTGLFDRAWPMYRPAIESVLPDFVTGKETREAMAHALVRAIAGGAEKSGR